MLAPIFHYLFFEFALKTLHAVSIIIIISVSVVCIAIILMPFIENLSGLRSITAKNNANIKIVKALVFLACPGHEFNVSSNCMKKRLQKDLQLFMEME